MKALSNLEKVLVIEAKKSVDAWFKGNDAELQEKSSKVKGPSRPPWGFIAVLLSVLFLLLTPYRQPMFFVGGLIGVIVGMVSGILMLNKDDAVAAQLRRARFQELTLEREQDPFFQRAKLIANACAAFERRSLQYANWSAAVHEGLMEPDEERAKELHAFLSRAANVIGRASQNFTASLELARRTAAFEATHPRVESDPRDSALSELMSRLDQPMEAPEAPALPEAKLAWEYEQALQELCEEPGRKLG